MATDAPKQALPGNDGRAPIAPGGPLSGHVTHKEAGSIGPLRAHPMARGLGALPEECLPTGRTRSAPALIGWAANAGASGRYVGPCSGPTGPCLHGDGIGHAGDHVRPR